MKKILRWIVVCLALALLIVVAIGMLQNKVSELVITPTSLSLAKGVSVQLMVNGYTKSGTTATEAQMEDISLVWNCKTDNEAFSVSESGYLTAETFGIGNVWVESADGTLHSRAITVIVK